MDSKNEQIFGRNLVTIRKKIGISQYNFALFLQISLKTLTSIENHRSKLKLETARFIKRKFPMYSLDNLSENLVEPKDDFREALLVTTRENYPDLLTHLTTPRLVDAIKGYLLKSELIKDGAEVKSVKLYFEKMGWFYLSSSISLALTRLVKDGTLITVEQEKLGVFLYKLK